MFVLVLAAEADETRQAVTLLIVCLVGIAVMLAVLTVWYWLFTSPKRRAGRLLKDLGHYAPSEFGAEDSTVVGAAMAQAADVELVGAGVGRDSEAAIASEPAILSESSELLSSMLAGSEQPERPPTQPVKPAESARPVEPVEPAERAMVETTPPGQQTEPVPQGERVRQPEPAHARVPTQQPQPAPPRRPGRPDLHVAAAPKTVRRPDAKPTGPPTSVQPAKPIAPAAARSTNPARTTNRSRNTVAPRNSAPPRSSAKQRPTGRPVPEHLAAVHQDQQAKPRSVPKSSQEAPPGERRDGSGRIEVAARPSVGPTAAEKRSAEDELAKVRQRRARRERDQEGLSDDDWAAVMKSAFNHLNR